MSTVWGVLHIPESGAQPVLLLYSKRQALLFVNEAGAQEEINRLLEKAELKGYLWTLEIRA